MLLFNTPRLLVAARTRYCNQYSAGNFNPAKILASFNSGRTVDNHHLSASWDCETAEEVLRKALRATDEEILALKKQIDRDNLRLTHLSNCRPMIVAFRQQNKQMKGRWELMGGKPNALAPRPRLLEKLNNRLSAMEKISEHH